MLKISLSNIRAALLPTLLLVTACSEEVPQALGTLERDRVTLSATAGEIITAQPVAEGSRVSTGQLLVQLDDTRQRLVEEKLQAEIAQLESRLLQLRNGPRPEEIAAARARVESAEAQQQQFERDVVRMRDLVSRQLRAQADLDDALTRVATGAAHIRDARAQLELLLAGTREEEIDQAQAALQASRTQLAIEQDKREDLAIVATRDAILDSLPFHVGERVATGAQVAVLLDAAPPFARVYIPEPSRVNIAVGDNLRVHVDGIAQTFTGTVRWIATEPAFTPYYALNRTERSRLVYPAEIQLDDQAGDLPSGLPVQADLP